MLISEKKRSKAGKERKKTERMRKSSVKSGSKGRERSRRTSLIRATAFFIYTPTDTHQNISYLPAYVCTIYGALGRGTEERKRGEGLKYA